MNIPRFLTGFYLLFWGYETGNILIGIGMALVAEYLNTTKKKRHLSVNDFVTISDTVSLILVASLIMIFVLYPPRQAPYLLVEWLPIINIPLLFAQYISSGNSVVIGTRFGGKKGAPHTHRPFNFAFLFFGMTLFSAATGVNRGEEFFPVLILLTFFTFFPSRSRRFSRWLFFMTGVIVVALSFMGNRGYLAAHRVIREAARDWLVAYYNRYQRDYSKNITSLGDVGEMKLSGAIVMHLKGKKPPQLIKEAAFTTFGGTIWFHKETQVVQIQAEEDGWVVASETSETSLPLHINYYFPHKRGVLPLPYNTAVIQNLNVAGLERNGVGKFMVEEGPPLLDYDIVFSDSTTLMAPTRADLTISKDEYETVKKITESFSVTTESSGEERVNAVKKYLAQFSYSLSLKGQGRYKTPLQNFLLHTKQGHCELFATATVLLLRSLHLPARYAIGYSISEKGAFLDDYIVRERHGHAWAEVYYNGQWRVVDTTPSVWFSSDAKNSSVFERLYDFVDFIKFSYKKYRLEEREKSSFYMVSAIVLLSLFLVIRIVLRMRKNRLVRSDTRNNQMRKNSPFRKIITLLQKRGVIKEEHETMHEYMSRATEILSIEMPPERLFYLHNKVLFDSQGISKAEMAELVSGVAGWLFLAQSR